MGIYINPGNEAFRVKRNGTYIDKSGLIAVVNRSLGLPHKLSCISRPRRFGGRSPCPPRSRGQCASV